MDIKLLTLKRNLGHFQFYVYCSGLFITKWLPLNARICQALQEDDFSPCRNAARCGDAAWSRLLGLMGLERRLREATPAVQRWDSLGKPAAWGLVPLGLASPILPWGPAEMMTELYCAPFSTFLSVSVLPAQCVCVCTSWVKILRVWKLGPCGSLNLAQTPLWTAHTSLTNQLEIVRLWQPLWS